MIVRVIVQVTSDDGMPIATSTAEEQTMQIDDAEQNLLAVEAVLDQLAGRCTASIHDQVEALRVLEAPAARSRPMGRRPR